MLPYSPASIARLFIGNSFSGEAKLRKRIPGSLLFCALSAIVCHAGVTVSSPVNNANVGSSANFVASATSPYSPIAAMTINIDSKDVYKINASSLNVTLPLSAAGHQVYVKAWDNQDHYFQQVLTVNAGTTGTVTISNIQSMSGWTSCSSCAGKGGTGPNVPNSMTPNQTSPSLDGQSAQFWLGGTPATPYANALFFEKLAPAAVANNFKLDFYMYVKDPTKTQAIEMDIFYSRGGHKNYFLTECDLSGQYAGTWQVSNAVIDTWQHTGLPCHVNAYAWNHVVLQFYRNPDGSTHFVSVSMNGDMHYVNRDYPAGAVNSFEMNAAIQLDGDSHQDNFSVWIDKMTVTYW